MFCVQCELFCSFVHVHFDLVVKCAYIPSHFCCCCCCWRVSKAAECRQSYSQQNANAKMLIKTCVSESRKILYTATNVVVVVVAVVAVIAVIVESVYCFFLLLILLSLVFSIRLARQTSLLHVYFGLKFGAFGRPVFEWREKIAKVHHCSVVRSPNATEFFVICCLLFVCHVFCWFCWLFLVS